MPDDTRHPLDVIYHDGPCIVVNKPAGILTQSPPGIPSLEDNVRQYVKQAEGKSPEDKIYLGVPHRLDRPASGAIVFGRHIRATRRLSAQFEKRTVKKTYWALVQRSDDLPNEGTWRDRLRKIPGRSFVEVVDENHAEGKLAVLHFRRRHDLQTQTLLEIELETGRTHQIRVQCASRGFPLLGDDQYGSTTGFGPAFDDPRDRAIALHARSLEFDHPMKRERVQMNRRTWCSLASHSWHLKPYLKRISRLGTHHFERTMFAVEDHGPLNRCQRRQISRSEMNRKRKKTKQDRAEVGEKFRANPETKSPGCGSN